MKSSRHWSSLLAASVFSEPWRAPRQLQFVQTSSSSVFQRREGVSIKIYLQILRAIRRPCHPKVGLFERMGLLANSWLMIAATFVPAKHFLFFIFLPNPAPEVKSPRWIQKPQLKLIRSTWLHQTKLILSEWWLYPLWKAEVIIIIKSDRYRRKSNHSGAKKAFTLLSFWRINSKLPSYKRHFSLQQEVRGLKLF